MMPNLTEATLSEQPQTQTIVNDLQKLRDRLSLLAGQQRELADNLLGAHLSDEGIGVTSPAREGWRATIMQHIEDTNLHVDGLFADFYRIAEAVDHGKTD
jgi:hypothetical protein